MNKILAFAAVLMLGCGGRSIPEASLPPEVETSSIQVQAEGLLPRADVNHYPTHVVVFTVRNNAGNVRTFVVVDNGHGSLDLEPW